MGRESTIEWTDATWPVVKGCDYASPGCGNCYAADLVHRHSHNPNPKVSLPVAGLTEVRGGRPRWTGKVYLNEPHLNDPLRWKKPLRIFVPSHGDLFHPDVPFGFVMRCLTVMARTPHHTYQVLTKRPDRMADFFRRWADLAGEDFEPKLVRGPEATRRAHPSGRGQLFADYLESIGEPPPGAAYQTFDWMEGMIGWPKVFRNVWLGFSVENQEWFDKRAAQMMPLMNKGWTLFVSAEPLLGPIDMAAEDTVLYCNACGQVTTGDDGDCSACGDTRTRERRFIDYLQWVIAGGESGKHARPCDVEWVRSIVEQCKAADVACFVKQLGSEPGWDSQGGKVPGSFHHFDAKSGLHIKRLDNRKGGDPDEWPEDLRVREYPEPARAP